MDDIPSNQLLEQLPTQNEIMQSNNDSQTSSDYNPPPQYDNNIPQQPLDNNINNNYQQSSSNCIPPPIYDNNISQQNLDNNNYTPPPIYDNNIPQEYSKPSENVPSQYPSIPAQNQNKPNTIYQRLNLQNPLSQNINNNYPPQSNINPKNSNIYDNQIYLPLDNPTPTSVEIKNEEPKLEVQDPVYQLQVVPAPVSNQNQNQKKILNNATNDSCAECCEDCCDKFCTCLARSLAICCRNFIAACCEAILTGLCK